MGRVCSDAAEGKLNDKSVMLETSRDTGMGRRIGLDLSKAEEYALFPGQVSTRMTKCTQVIKWGVNFR